MQRTNYIASVKEEMSCYKPSLQLLSRRFLWLLCPCESAHPFSTGKDSSELPRLKPPPSRSKTISTVRSHHWYPVGGCDLIVTFKCKSADTVLKTFKPKQGAVFICLLILKAKNKDIFSSPSKRLRGEVKFCSSRAVRMRCGTRLNADLTFSVHMMMRRLPQPHREVTRRSVNPPLLHQQKALVCIQCVLACSVHMSSLRCNACMYMCR